MLADVPCDLPYYRQRQAQLLAMVQLMLQLQLKQVGRIRPEQLRCWQFGFKLRVFLVSCAELLRSFSLRMGPLPV